MSDYISRQTVLRCIKESRDGIDWGQSEDGDAFLHYSAALYRTIDSEECVPAADVVPYSIEPDGTLTVTVPKGTKVGRVLVQEDGTHWGGLYYAD